MRVAGVTPSLHRTLILHYYFLFLVRTFCVLLSFSLNVREVSNSDKFHEIRLHEYQREKPEFDRNLAKLVKEIK